MKYITGFNRNQTVLVSETYDLLIKKDNVVRFVDAFVDALNKPLVDSDMLPIGSNFVVTEILGGRVVISDATASQLTLAQLKAQLISNPLINSGYYSLKLTVNGIDQHIKIFKQ